MIAMTATVRPTAQALPLLGQNLRRHHEHHLLVVDQMLVLVPDVGEVLVTEGFGRVRIDLVSDSEEALPGLMSNLESDLRALMLGEHLSVEWKKAAAIPAPFR